MNASTDLAQKPLEIAEATRAQFSLIWPMLHEAIELGESFPYAPGSSESEVCAQWFAHGARVFIAFEGSVPVASRYIVENKTGLGSHICNMGVIVAKDARSRGVGDAMMKFGLAKARELGFRAVQLNLVVVRNCASIALCQRHGFVTIGVVPNAFFYKQREYVDALVMYKSLV